MPQTVKTLSLACLSLATKSTEAPRRTRQLLLPAHRLLHQGSAESEVRQTIQTLQVPSTAYDVLRATLVQAELMLLRVLGFELRVSLALEFLPRYLERTMEDIAGAGEDYGCWARDEKEEHRVVGEVIETGIGKACRAQAISA